MMLVCMIATDEDAFICDMAETYRIYDYRSLPISYIATLAAGLRKDSRIKSELSGITSHMNLEYLLAFLCDNVMLIRYLLCADPPTDYTLFTDMMTQEQQTSDALTFRSGADFRREWERLTGN